MPAGALKVVVYEGQKQWALSGGAHKVVTAAELAAADIVLATYDTLRRDLNLEPMASEGRELRRAKKYEVSSLLLLCWLLMPDCRSLSCIDPEAAACKKCIRQGHTQTGLCVS